MDKFVLIDGNAILHRAYHALPPFTTSKGKPIGAIFGFVSMLLKIISDMKPTYIAVSFDRPKPTFRQELFVGYQAGRPAMEDDLLSQVEGVHEVVKVLDIPIFEVDGYEADDCIGTLALQSQKSRQRRGSPKAAKVKSKQSLRSDELEKLEVIIVSGDRDLLQLVNPHVMMYAPIKGLSETKLYDERAVVEKFGVTPSQFIDMKALMGDASDQYPGVHGIGPKTARDLLQKYGTLENLYKHLGELSERVGKALAEGTEQAGLAKKLATIVTDVPIKLDIEKCRFQVKDKEKAVKLFQSFEFKTLTNRLIDVLEGRPINVAPAPKAKTEKKKEDDSQLRLV